MSIKNKAMAIAMCVCMSTLSVASCQTGGLGSTDSTTNPNQSTTEGEMPNYNKELSDSIKSHVKDQVVNTANTDKGVITSVSQKNNSVTNTKTEFKIDVENITGNVYDPSEVDVYGEFVSPSGDVTFVPAFYTADYDISLLEGDTTSEYDYPQTENFVESGNSYVKGVLDNDDYVSTAKMYLSTGQISKSITIDSKLSTANSIFFNLKQGASTTDLTVTLSSGTETVFTTSLTNDNSNTWQKIDLDLSDAFDLSDGTPINKLLNTIDTITFAGNGEIYVRDIGYQRIREDNGKIQNITVVSPLNVEEYKYYYVPDTYYGEEVVKKADTDPYFAIRYNAPEVGDYAFRVTMKTENEIASTFASTFTANQTTKENVGVIAVEPTQNRNFMYAESGDGFMPVGMNVGWYNEALGGKNTYELENYFIAMNNSGLNWARTWLAHWQFSMHNEVDGILNFDSRLIEASKFDRMMESAEENGIYITLCLLMHGAFREGNEGLATQWPANPFNEALGGYIDSENPIEILTNQRFRDDFKKITRYTLARWGYSENIMAWEIFNEVGHIAGYGDYQDASVEFHKDMANYIKGMDQLDHMVTSSSASTYDIIYGVDELDYINPHWYTNSYGDNLAVLQADLFKEFNKPILVSEIGLSGNNNVLNFASDTKGIYLNQASWIGNFVNGAGGGMSWWWEAIHERDLYYQYEPLTNFFKYMDNNYVTMPSVSTDTVTASSSFVKAGGYLSNNKGYIYLYDTRFKGIATGGNLVNSSIDVTIDSGDYTVSVYNCKTGEFISENIAVTATNNKASISLPTWADHIAIIIE